MKNITQHNSAPRKRKSILNTQKLINSALSVAGLAVMGMGVAHADIIPVFISAVPSGTNTLFTYEIDLTNDQQVAPPTGNINTDSFATIYDFAGYVPGSVTTTSLLTSSVQNVGVTPPKISSSFDDAGIPNLTIRYSGLTMLTGPQTLGTVTALSTFSGVSPLGNFAAQAQKSVGNSKGTTIDNVGNTTVPVGPTAVPEPASVIPFALGGLGLLGLIVRKTRRTSGAAA